MSNITEQLKELKNVKPKQDWVDSQRELLMSQIKVQSTRKPQSFLVNSWFFAKSTMPTGVLRFVARPVGVFVVLLMLVVGTGMLGVNASKTSLPGDFLYPVKLTSEKVLVGFTAGEENKAEKRIEFVEERVKEIEAVVAQDETIGEKQKMVEQAVEAIKTEMVKAQAELDKIEERPEQGKEQATITVEVVQNLDKIAEEVSDKLKQAKTDFADETISKSLTEAEEAVEQTGVKAVEVIVDVIEKGEVDVSEKEVVDAIAKKIENAKEKVEQAIEAVESAETPVVEVIVEDVEVEDREDKEDNSEIDEKVTAVEPVEEIANTPEEAKADLTEAEDLLNQGDLTSALELIKSSSQTAKDVMTAVEVQVDVEVAQPTATIGITIE
jgi:hypothetical protein